MPLATSPRRTALAKQVLKADASIRRPSSLQSTISTRLHAHLCARSGISRRFWVVTCMAKLWWAKSWQKSLHQFKWKKSRKNRTRR